MLALFRAFFQFEKFAFRARSWKMCEKRIFWNAILPQTWFFPKTQRPWTRSPIGWWDRSTSRCWFVRSIWRSPRRLWIIKKIASTCRIGCSPVAASRCWVDVGAETLASWSWNPWTSIRTHRRIVKLARNNWRNWWKIYASEYATPDNSGFICLTNCATTVWWCHPATRRNVGTARTWTSEWISANNILNFWI